MQSGFLRYRISAAGVFAAATSRGFNMVIRVSGAAATPGFEASRHLCRR